jgi:hypothetical protein
MAQKPQTPNLRTFAMLVFGWLGSTAAVTFKRYKVLIIGVESATSRNMRKATKRRKKVEKEIRR